MDGKFCIQTNISGHFYIQSISSIADTSNESSLIVIVLDSNPSQRIVRQNPQQLTQCLDSICVFANAHLMQRAQNSIAALACHHHAMYD